MKLSDAWECERERSAIKDFWQDIMEDWKGNSILAGIIGVATYVVFFL